MHEYARSAATGLAAGLIAYAAEVVAARRILTRPDPDPVPAAWQPPGNEFAVRRPDGTSLHAVAAGRGVPLVLSHGVMLSVTVWSLVYEPLLERGFRVIAYDHRGHGRSTVGADGLSMASFADDLVAVLDACDARDGLVLGHSMGGLAMLAALERHPELRASLAGLVLAGTTPVTYDIPAAAAAATEALVRRGAMGALFTSRLHGTLLARIGFRRPLPSAVEALRSMIGATPDATLAHGNGALVACDFRPFLPSIATATVVLAGTRDLLVPRGSARAFRRGLPNATVLELPVGHMVPYEAPQRLVEETARLGVRAGLLPR